MHARNSNFLIYLAYDVLYIATVLTNTVRTTKVI